MGIVGPTFDCRPGRVDHVIAPPGRTGRGGVRPCDPCHNDADGARPRVPDQWLLNWCRRYLDRVSPGRSPQDAAAADQAARRKDSLARLSADDPIEKTRPWPSRWPAPMDETDHKSSVIETDSSLLGRYIDVIA